MADSGASARAGLSTVRSSSSGTLLFPMTCRLMEYSAVITRIPARSPLIRNFVCRTPVVRPAAIPARNAAAVAASGCAPLTIIAAATAPPSVIEPSTVRSRKASTRKLMSTPSARRARMSPCVSDPISRIIRRKTFCPSWYESKETEMRKRTEPPAPSLSLLFQARRRHAVSRRALRGRNPAHPHGPAGELAFPGTVDRPEVPQEVQHGLQVFRVEQRRHRLPEIDRPLFHRTIRKDCSMKMTEQASCWTHWPQERSQLCQRAVRRTADGDSDDERQRPGMDLLRCERKPLAHFRMVKHVPRSVFLDGRSLQRGAEQSGRFGNQHDAGGRRVHQRQRLFRQRRKTDALGALGRSKTEQFAE